MYYKLRARHTYCVDGVQPHHCHAPTCSSTMYTSVSTQSRPPRVSYTPHGLCPIRQQFVRDFFRAEFLARPHHWQWHAPCPFRISLVVTWGLQHRIRYWLCTNLGQPRGQSLSPYFTLRFAMFLPSQHGKPRKHRSIFDRSWLSFGQILIRYTFSE